MLGYDPNSDADVSAFLQRFVKPLLQRGVAVVLLDNVGHVDKDRPKNSGTKLDSVPQGYKVEAKSTFSVAEQGLVQITCTRSRFGDMSRSWSMRIGHGIYEVPVSKSATVDDKRREEIMLKREALRDRCVRVLTDHAPLSRDDLLDAARKRGAKGRNATLRTWLEELVAEPGTGLDHGPDGYVLEGGPDHRGHPPGPEHAGHPRATPTHETTESPMTTGDQGGPA